MGYEEVVWRRTMALERVEAVAALMRQTRTGGAWEELCPEQRRERNVRERCGEARRGRGGDA